jgi:uncharacterized membrane protein (DUF373 family)
MLRKIKDLITKDAAFLHLTEGIENLVSKILSLGMILVAIMAITHLGYVLIETIFDSLYKPSASTFNGTLFRLFGLFLNVLIALEILENITGYLKKNVIHVELVIVTSLIAVSRKIIILDLEKKNSTDLIAMGIAVFALSISYALIRLVNRHQR